MPPALLAKLRQALDTLDELHDRAWRDGPQTILERYLEITGDVLNQLATTAVESHRAVANIGSFLRFAGDWQRAHPEGHLAGFVDYLDAYQEAGGELPTSIELAEDVRGVRLMTLYQAKGLEFDHVVIPQLLRDEWPTKEGWSGWFPPELLREPIEGTDLHLEEERRLLYVAMTRARDTSC
jgi:DNA helicase-2/ATP-dependent DNA helicase PcrA